MSVTQTGLDEASRSLEAIAARLRDLTPVTSVIAADTATLIDDSFANSREPTGSAFAPLAPATVARRRGGSATPLVDTSRLRASVFARGLRTGVQFGTNVGYGRPHQIGTSRIPKRAFLPVESSGSAFVLTTTGPAGQHWDRARTSISRFIRTGEVS